MNGSPMQATFFCFLNGTLILFFAYIGSHFVIKDEWFCVQQSYFHWYIFGGGLLAFCIANLLIICPTYIGFTATFIGVIFGNLVTSLVFDFIGLFGVRKREILILEIFGVFVVFVGAIFAYKTENENDDKQNKKKQKSEMAKVRMADNSLHDYVE